MRLPLKDIAVLLAVASGLIGGYVHIVSEAKAQTEAGMKPVEVRLATVEQEQRQVKNDLHEVQTDIRALYKAMMTGQRQERLEGDGGK